MSEYIRVFRSYCDELATIGKSINDKNRVFGILKGLGRGYESFVTTMFKPPMPSFREIVPLLQSH